MDNKFPLIQKLLLANSFLNKNNPIEMQCYGELSSVGFYYGVLVAKNERPFLLEIEIQLILFEP